MQVLGGDLAGVVLDAGSSTRYAVGDRVFGQLDTFSPLRSSGTYAEKARLGLCASACARELTKMRRRWLPERSGWPPYRQASRSSRLQPSALWA